MRYLFLSNFYPPHELGGFEQLCEEVARILVRRGHIIEVLTSRYKSNSRQIQDGIQINRELFLQADINFYKPLDFFFKRGFEEKLNKRILNARIEQFRPDAIMVWGMWNISLNLTRLVESKMHKNVYYYIASYWPIDVDPHHAYWNLPARHSGKHIMKRILRWTALKILDNEGYPPRLAFQNVKCVSRYVRDELVRKKGLPENAGVLYGGIDPALFVVPASEILSRKFHPLKLLYFGRLIHDKGVHTAVEALSILRQWNIVDRVELMILGSGHPDYELKLQKLVQETGLSNYVKFIKQVPRKEIPEVLKRHDVFLFTSIWPEPMARSVMEAMAAGLLVIGTEVGGQTEMLRNGENGLTFQPGDAQGLADQIKIILDDQPTVHRLALAGQDMVLKQYTLERMADGFEKDLVSIAGGHTPD